MLVVSVFCLCRSQQNLSYSIITRLSTLFLIFFYFFQNPGQPQDVYCFLEGFFLLMEKFFLYLVNINLKLLEKIFVANRYASNRTLLSISSQCSYVNIILECFVEFRSFSYSLIVYSVKY